jgi:hypothetical protein
MRRKAAADRAEKTANLRPSSTRAAGAGGSSSTMLSKCAPRWTDHEKRWKLQRASCFEDDSRGYDTIRLAGMTLEDFG